MPSWCGSSASEAVVADCGHASQCLSQTEHKDGLSRGQMCATAMNGNSKKQHAF